MQIEFETVRCIVRTFREDDIDTFMDYRNNDEWMKYQGFKGLSKQVYREALLCPCDITHGVQLAIINKQTDALIGDIYLKQQGNACWMGYTIHPKHVRRGYMYEVVSAAMKMMANQGIEEVKAGVLPKNHRSVELLKKLNFVLIGTEGDEQIFRYRLA